MKQNSQISLGSGEMALSRHLQIDRDILAALKEESAGPVIQAEGTDENGAPVSAEGIMAPVEEGRVQRLMGVLTELCRGRGLTPFRWARNYGEGPDIVAIIKTSDDLDAVRIQNTHDPKGRVSNGKILETVRKWQKICRLNVVGASGNSLEIKFSEPPPQTDQLTAEAIALCFDNGDESADYRETVEDQIRRYRRLFLWWD